MPDFEHKKENGMLLIRIKICYWWRPDLGGPKSQKNPNPLNIILITSKNITTNILHRRD